MAQTARITTDLSRPVAGHLDLAVRAEGPPETYDAFIDVVLDGRRLGRINFGHFGAPPPAAPFAVDRTFPIDTTTLADGGHLIDWIVANHATDGGYRVVDYGSASFATANGAAPRALSAGWAQLRLAQGGTKSLAPHLRNCDGSTAPAGAVAFASDNPDVATVDAKGVVTGVAPGVATVRTSAGGRSAATRVVVAAAVGMPHLSRGGAILSAYTPGQSTFVRSVFNLGWDALRTDPTLADAAHAAGVNALDQGFYLNPSADSQPAQYLDWARQNYASHLQVAGDNGFLLVAGGDNWARGPDVLGATLASPLAAPAAALALSMMRDSGIVPMIEVVDESTALLGIAPPPGVAALVGVFNQTAGRPAIGWSIFSLHDPAIVGRNWTSATDYYSLMSSPPGWADSIRGFSVPTEVDTLAGRADALLAVMDPGKPLAITNIDIDGRPSYPSGPDMQPLQPHKVTAQIMAAVACGATAIRSYQLDGGDTYPTGPPAGRARWAALGAAYSLIGRLEPDLLQPIASAVDAGPGFLTGARGGPDGRVLVVLGDSDVPATADVDLTPYAAGGFGRITAHRIWGAETSTAAIAPAGRDRPRLRPGEAIVYVFTRGGPPPPAWQAAGGP